jgi:hypothetical protein
MSKQNSHYKKCTDGTMYIEDDEFEANNSCTLCSGDYKTVSFKGQMVCEKCLDFVKDEY